MALILSHAIMPSSVIAYINYNEATATLRITFVSGTVYDYKKVPVQIYKAMIAASSKGIYFNQHIKDHFAFEKIG